VFQFGYCERVLSIPVGEAMGGYSGRLGPSEGTHDELFARAVSFTLGNDTIVLCSVDVVGLSRKEIVDVKRQVEEVTGTPPDHILISATHTHSGPRVIDLFAPRVPSSHLVYDAIRVALLGSLESTMPVILKAGSVKIEGAGFNRRDWDPHSEVVDENAEVLGVYDQEGNLLTLLYNYGCHCVVLPPENPLYSEDWPFYAQTEIAQQLNLEMLPIFFQGAAGNINPVGVPYSGGVKHTFEDAQQLGQLIARQILAGLDDLEELPEIPPDGRIDTITIPADDPDKLEDFSFATVEEEDGVPKVITEVQVLALGRLLFFAVPGELFGEWSIDLKQFALTRPAWVVGYANDYIGYVPTTDAFKAGGYEATMMGLSDKEGEQITSRLKDLATEL